jgi:cyclopropane-fatty-acyl-phospholipid synthase
MDLIARKLKLEPGLRVLDIGCGWGGFDAYISENYGVAVTGVTVSERQKEFADNAYKGTPARVELRDYRDLEGAWDRVVSIGMFEHVGVSHYRTFMEQAHRLLRPDGLMLLHTIGANASRTNCDPWIEKYIFPNSMLPSARQITTAAEGLFMMEDWHNLGPDYDPTLMSWRQNFTEAWPDLKTRYGPDFFRMWTYYLMASAGSFRARRNQLWQVVFSPVEYEGQYRSVR